MAEKVMQDLMNDPDVSADTRTFNALINGYRCSFHKDSRNRRAERMYFWLVQHLYFPFLVSTNHSGPLTLACHFDRRRPWKTFPSLNWDEILN